MVLSANVAHLLVSGHAAVLFVTLTVPSSSNIYRKACLNSPSARTEVLFPGLKSCQMAQIWRLALAPLLTPLSWRIGSYCQSKCDQPRPYSLDKWLDKWLQLQNELFWRPCWKKVHFILDMWIPLFVGLVWCLLRTLQFPHETIASTSTVLYRDSPGLKSQPHYLFFFPIMSSQTPPAAEQTRWWTVHSPLHNLLERR